MAVMSTVSVERPRSGRYASFSMTTPMTAQMAMAPSSTATPAGMEAEGT
jgi:hypothetical protein